MPSTITGREMPKVGSVWRDKKHRDRKLTITFTSPDSTLDRHIIGYVTGRLGEGEYATSIDIFLAVWEEDS